MRRFGQRREVTMDVYQRQDILDDHKTWLDTGGKKGTRADFSRMSLDFLQLSKADLRNAVFQGASLIQTDLREAKLQGANLIAADLTGADLSEANLQRAELNGARLYNANFQGADLREANIRNADLVKTNLKHANLTGCSVYGISVWDLIVNDKTTQLNLVITPGDEPVVTVDNLEVAQFIYLMLNRRKLRDILDTIISKAVLILGRFTPERKAVLDAMAEELRKHNLLPIIFDFERSSQRDFTETIRILAGLSLFVIVDLTRPRSAPQELTATVPDYQIPFVPILEEGEDPYSMYNDLTKYDWLLKPVLKYRTQEELVAHFRDMILERAWSKHLELLRKKNEKLEMVSIDQMLREKESELPLKPDVPRKAN
jgi:uncharacterized protein YjbI with pentapeptide repeats